MKGVINHGIRNDYGDVIRIWYCSTDLTYIINNKGWVHQRPFLFDFSLILAHFTASIMENTIKI